MYGEKSKASTSSNDLPRGAIDIKGNPVDRNARLPSIRRPRDLTLGAVSKLQFAPKIPPRRNKPPEPVVVKKEPIRGRSYERPMPSTSGVRYNRPPRPPRQFLQTPGSLIADPKLNPSKKEKNAIRAAKNCQDIKHVSEKSPEKPAKQATKPQYRRIIRQEDSDDSESSSDFSDEEDLVLNSFVPNNLPLNSMIEDSIGKENLNSLPQLVKEMNMTGNKELLLMELSNSFYLPFENCEDCVNEPPLRNLVTETSTELLSKQHLPLGELPEGKIGKLQILKSGKMCLVVGSVVYDDINLECDSLMLQEALCVHQDTDNLHSVTRLGNVQHKIRIAPNIRNLLTSSHVD